MLCACRHSSPLGGSTLMTSAPKSDRITAALGPAMKLAKSTTFSPEKILSFMVYLVRLSKGRARSGPAKKGAGTFCAKHPPGRSGKRCLTPFSPPGARHLLCEAPSGPFRQKVPDPFFAAWRVGFVLHLAIS